MSDPREFLLELLTRYERVWPGEEATGRIRELVERRADCFERTCWEPGHVTGSALILDAKRSRCLLTHHRKLDRWLQLGGHADGDPRIDEVVLREAREESGMEDFTLYVPPGGELVPYDLDVHDIPARKQDPLHEHHDVRFLLIAGADQELVVSDESHDLAWVPLEDLERYTDEVSVLRLRDKLPW